MVECSGLLNRRAGNCSEGSNPSSSAIYGDVSERFMVTALKSVDANTVRRFESCHLRQIAICRHRHVGFSPHGCYGDRLRGTIQKLDDYTNDIGAIRRSLLLKAARLEMLTGPVIRKTT